MDFFSQIEASFGVFIFYAIALGLLIMLFTFFVNIIRGVVTFALGIAMAYYLFMATPSTKTTMDNYMKNLFSSISGGTINIDSDKILNKIKSAI